MGCGMRAHSLEEEEPRFSYEAVIPIVKDGSDDLLIEPSTDVFEVLSAPTPKQVVYTELLGLSAGVVSQGTAVEGSELVDVVVEGAGAATTIRMSAGAYEALEPDVVIYSPTTMQIGTRFRVGRIKAVFEPDKFQEPWNFETWLPLARVHRPSREGCVTTYSVMDKTVGNYDVNFSFGTVGIGGSSKFALSFGQMYSASRTCKEIKIRARVQVIFGTNYLNGHQWEPGARVVISGVELDSCKIADILASADQCGYAEEKMPKSPRTYRDLFDASGQEKDASHDVMKIATSVVGRVSLGFGIPRTPISLAVGYTRSCAHTVELATQFMPGARYVGYFPQPQNPLEKCWSITAQRRKSKGAS
jgi:hypothetical protein